MQLSNNKILITGGGSGIGQAMAERLIKEGNTVIICGRRSSVLQAFAERQPGLITRVCDLSNEADRIALYEWIAKEHSDLNMLVNNAGIQNWMSLNDEDFYQRAMEEIRTNIEAPLHLTSLFLELKSLNTILNVTSGLAYVPLTKVPVYSATKAFFHSYTVSLQHLLSSRGIEVIEVIPPALNTDLGGKGLHDQFPPVSAFIESIFNQLAEGKNKLTFGFSENLSEAGQDVFQGVFSQMNPSVQ